MGPVDFTGYWALVKHEGMDDFLRSVGFPWVVRKAALKFGGAGVDVISHYGGGSLMRVTSLNAKGSWSRQYDVDREVVQPNAEGTPCKTSSWWEGRVFRSRMEGSELGVVQSWRYMRGNRMAVRTELRPARGGPEAVMWWFYDRMETLQRHVARGGGTLLQQIESDQRRVVRATHTDTRYIQAVLLDWQRWQSPADDFIHVEAPHASLARQSRPRTVRSPGSGSPRSQVTPMSMSKSPSNDSLAALPPGVELRSDTRSLHSDSRGSRGLHHAHQTEAEMSSNALDRMARQAAAMAMSDSGGVDSLGSSQKLQGSGRVPAVAAPVSAAVAAGGQQQQQQQQQQGQGQGQGQAGSRGEQGEQQRPYSREPTLSYPGGVEVPVEAQAAATDKAHPQSGDSVTFRPSSASSPHSRQPLEAGEAGSGSGASHPLAPESDAATRGSAHHRSPSLGSMAGQHSIAAQRSAHYKNMSADSMGRGAASTPGRNSPRSTTPAALPPLSHAEHVMAARLHEFSDIRGIAAVVPVATPNDTAEPQLLSMSPEQAEETAAKLRELETDMLLRRQENRRGCTLCGCFVITLASDTLPEHLRVWEQLLT
ncbi:hypothetical protein D9Q98_006607 [Chlorella vulgaris]|uniref:Uncharacterized protein n=1 Tax=Chlorella vulgaris TaxID=3077 RepID=A0A9D4TKT4_CHLVU|nr:hypothetical protein D9Q98_006607 [Chlorella vulgaris]